MSVENAPITSAPDSPPESGPRTWSQFVPGDPAPKGSGVQFFDERSQRWVFKQSSKRLKAWSQVVAQVATYARPRGGPFEGPLEVSLTFLLRRPRTVRDPWPIKRGTGDADKLARGVLDAIDPVIGDDAKVVRLYVGKRWAEHDAGCLILVRELP